MVTIARYEQAPLHVVKAHYTGGYCVWLKFSDGRKGVVDLADELHGATLAPEFVERLDARVRPKIRLS